MNRLALLPVALLAGCMLAKPPAHDTIVHDALPATTKIPTTWTSAATTNAVAGDWLKTFHDPALDAIVAEAITNNLDLRQAAAKVEIARQDIALATAQLLPHLNGQVDFSRTRDSGVSKNYDANTEYGILSWELDVWGKLRSQRAAAKAGYQAAALDYAWARQSLAATTAKSWFLASETRQLVALAGQAVTVYSNALALTKLKSSAGQVAELDVAEASAKLNEAQSELRQTQILDAMVRRALEVILGRYPAAELAANAAFVPVPPPVTAGVPTALLRERPDILAAEQSVLETFRLRETAKLSLLPTIALSFEGGHFSDNALTLLGLNPYILRGMAGAAIPVYDGGALVARIRIAGAQQQQAVARYGSVVLNAFREVETALTDEGLLAQRIDYSSAALQDRTESVRIITEQYQAGACDMLPVLQLQAAQLASAAELIKLHRAQLTNRIQLHLALGGSFDAIVPKSNGQYAEH